MEKIRELIVAEGKHDVDRLHQLYDCDVITTSGLSLSEDVLDFIEKAAEKRGVIVLTDSDHAGEVIRKRIAERVPSVGHAFVSKNKSIGKRNVGIEYASDEGLREALDNVVTFEKGQQTLSWQQYCDLGLIGDKKAREQLCERLHIGLCNNKTLFKRLNMLGLKEEDLR